MEENSQNIEQANDDFLEMETPDKESKKQEKNQKQQNIIQEEADEMALIEQRAQEKIN